MGDDLQGQELAKDHCAFAEPSQVARWCMLGALGWQWGCGILKWRFFTAFVELFVRIFRYCDSDITVNSLKCGARALKQHTGVFFRHRLNQPDVCSHVQMVPKAWESSHIWNVAFIIPVLLLRC